MLKMITIWGSFFLLLPNLTYLTYVIAPWVEGCSESPGLRPSPWVEGHPPLYIYIFNHYMLTFNYNFLMYNTSTIVN